MQSRHIAAYGSNLLERGFCKECNTTALIIDNEFQCCGAQAEAATEQLQVCSMSEPSNKRKHISNSTKQTILQAQENKCLYCQRPFGSYYTVKGKGQKKLQTKAVFDHIQPFINGGSINGNIVAACNLCNSFKSDKLFSNLLEAWLYISNQLANKITFYLSRNVNY